MKSLYSSIAIVLLSGLGAVQSVNAASANLTVSGTITPEACGITLGNGGVVDYGTHTPTYFQTVVGATSGSYGGSTAKKATQLLDAAIALNITCSLPTKLAVSVTDNRAAARFDSGTIYDGAKMGLASNVAGQKLGAYGIQHRYLTVNGTSNVGGRFIAANGATNWATLGNMFGGDDSAYFPPGYSIAFASASGLSAPDAISSVEGTVYLRTYLDSAILENPKSAITMDGSATFNLVYL